MPATSKRTSTKRTAKPPAKRATARKPGAAASSKRSSDRSSPRGSSPPPSATAAPLTLAAVQDKERKLAELLRKTRTITRGKDPKGGGWNRKSLEEHLQEGTYRKDRHGPIDAGVLKLQKPPGICRDTARAQRRWIRNASDEHAVRNGFRFNERLAEYTASFFPQYLRHSKGEWNGKPFELLPFQRDEIVYPLFGWVREDGTRRFRRAYIEIAKKSAGKSTLAAGIGLYMLLADEEPGAEIWSLGGDRSQARVVHQEAVNMIEASPDLDAVLKINHTNFNIAFQALRSYYRAVSASPRGKHGPSLHCAIADELHEWFGKELWRSLRYAFRARRQPLLLAITNAGADLQSVCYEQHQKAEAVVKGAIVDDDFFGLILGVSREEAEAEIAAVKAGATTLPVAAKCNPHLGSIVTERDLVQDIRDAIQTPSEIPNLLRLTYCVWNTGVTPWLSSEDWKACAERFSADDLAMAPCGAALDMSKTLDTTALALVFPDQEEEDLYRQLVYFWIPEKTVADRQHLVDYQPWIDSGHLRVMPGGVIDYAQLRADLLEILPRFGVRRFVYDPMYAKETAQWIEEHFGDIECAEFPQTLMQFAGPTAEYERLVIAGRLRHNDNPLLTWQAGHTKVYTDANRNKRPVKPKHGDIRTIDGLVAGIMALKGEMQTPAESAYEDHGVYYADDVMAEEGEADGE
jgi:phage terminase large subunit-like protein